MVTQLIEKFWYIVTGKMSLHGFVGIALYKVQSFLARITS